MCFFSSSSLEVSPVLSCQAGKKAVRAVLWVSADGLRVVDDKTKVKKMFSSQSIEKVQQVVYYSVHYQQ